MNKDHRKLIRRAVDARGIARPSERARFPLRGVSLARVANGGAGSSSRLLGQEASNIRLCRSVGGVVDERHRLREVGSGLDVPRPVMDLLWSIVANEEADAIFVEDLDRLYRDLVKLLSFCRHCVRHDVELWVSGVENGYRAIALDGRLVVPGEVGVVAQGAAGVLRDKGGWVRKVFKMASGGFSPQEIARRLNRSDG